MIMDRPDDCVLCHPEGLDNGYVRVEKRDRLEIFKAVPRDPVVPGHVMLFPNQHERDAASDPRLTGLVFECASWYARRLSAFNLITSAGRSATQTVGHLHVHVVPRSAKDGLMLPWTDQPKKFSVVTSKQLQEIPEVGTPVVVTLPFTYDNKGTYETGFAGTVIGHIEVNGKTSRLGVKVQHSDGSIFACELAWLQAVD